jgi:hypothetical protein
MGKSYRNNYLLAKVEYDESMPNYMKKTNFRCNKHGKNLVVKDRRKINNSKFDFSKQEYFKFPTKNSVKENIINNIDNTSGNDDVTIDDLKTNGLLLKNFNNPTINEYMIAIKQNADALIFVKNPTEEIYIEAVRRNGLVLQYIQNQSEKVCFTALNQNPLALQFIKNQTEEMIKFAVRKSAFTTTMIKKPSKELYYILVKENINSYNWMDTKYIDDEFINTTWEKILTKNGMMLRKCSKHSYKLYKIAIEQNPYAIQFINPELLASKELNYLCKSVIIKNPMILENIRNYHTYDSRIDIVKHSKLALQLNGMALKYLCNCQQSYCMIKIAITNNPNAYKYIKNRYYKFIFNESAYKKSKNRIDDCAVCYSSESHFIKYFTCDHLFCRNCIYNTDDIKKCPLCRQEQVRIVPELYIQYQ